MRKFIRILSLLIILSQSIVGCESDDAMIDKKNQIEIPNVDIKNKIVNANGFKYKIFYQENETQNNRRGLIILAIGDGTDINDATLNNQCELLAKKGFVAITTSYRPIPNNYQEWYVNFNEDMVQIMNTQTNQFNIPKSHVVLGGLSRGGNLLMGSVLPGQMGNNQQPISGIKGVILECAGGDEWKGSAILFPVIFMSNETDNAVGTNANAFKNGLQSNNNNNVKQNSHCLIISGEGHCTNSNEYVNFILKHIDSWFM